MGCPEGPASLIARNAYTKLYVLHPASIQGDVRSRAAKGTRTLFLICLISIMPAVAFLVLLGTNTIHHHRYFSAFTGNYLGGFIYDKEG